MKPFQIILSAILIISGAVCTIPCLGQDNNTAPELLPTHESVQNATITCMEKDNAGFLWIGTRNGLFRYNGTSFLPFIQADSLSIASNNITSLRADRGNNLWIGSDEGIHLINGRTLTRNSFLESGAVYGMANMDQRMLIHSGKEGLYIYDKESGESHLAYKDYDLAYSPSILMSQDRVIAIADNNTFRLYFFDPSLKPISVIDFGKTSLNGFTNYSGQIAIATSDGLCFFDTDGKRVPLPEKLKIFEGRNILFCKTDEYRMELVIGVKDIGIFRYYDTADSLTKVWQEENLSDTDKCECVVLKDNLALNKGGKVFSISHESNLEKKRLSGLARSESIQSVFTSEDPNNALIFTDRSVYLFNILTQNTINLNRVIIGEGSTLDKGYLDHDNNIWVISKDGKLTKFLPNSTGMGLRYSVGKQYEGDYSDSEFFCLNTGMMGVVTPTRVLFFDDEGNTLSERLPEGTARTPYVSSAGEIYLFGKEGVFKAGNSGPVEKIPVDIEATCLLEDNIGNLWIGTRDRGICIYNPTSKDKSWITTKEGLPENNVKSILLFRNRIWICCSSSIAYKEQNADNIVTLTDKSYSTNYTENCGTVADIMGLGTRIMFAGTQNLTILNPNKEESKRDIRLFLDEVSTIDYGIPTDEKDVVIPNKSNNIMFTYSAIDYDSGGKLSYEYILEGHDKEWTRAGKSLSTIYNHLEGGKYNFRVRVMTPSGEYSSSEIAFPFRIKGGFTRSWLFIILVSVILILFATMLIRILAQSRFRKEEYLREKSEKEFIAELTLTGNLFPKWTTENFMNALSLIYTPLRELEQDKGLEKSARQKVNLISKSIDRINRTIEEEANATLLGNVSSNRPLFVFEHPVKDVSKEIDELIGKLRWGRYLKTVDNIPPESKAWFDSVIMSSAALLVTSKFCYSKGKEKVMTIDSQIIDAEKVQNFSNMFIIPYF